MKKLFAVLAAAVPFGCNPAPGYPADVQSMVFDRGGTMVRLFPQACDTAKVKLPAGSPPMYAAKVRWQGKDYAACWTPAGNDTVFIIDEEGDGGPLPMSEFKPDDGV